MKGVLGRAYNFRGKPQNPALAAFQDANLGAASKLKKHAMEMERARGAAMELERINQERVRMGLRELTPEMLARQRMEGEAYRARAFEHQVARNLNVAEERKAIKEASERVRGIVKSELNPVMANLLSSELVRLLGPGVIMQLHQQGQLKEFLSQSGELKRIILTLKKGGRIQKNQMNDAVEELKELFQQAQEQ